MSVKKPTQVLIGHDGDGAGEGWYLANVVVKDKKDSKTEYIFNCDRYGAVLNISLNSSFDIHVVHRLGVSGVYRIFQWGRGGGGQSMEGRQGREISENYCIKMVFIFAH